MTDQDIRHLTEIYKDKTPTADDIKADLEAFNLFKDKKDKLQKLRKTLSHKAKQEQEEAEELRISKQAYYDMLKRIGE